LYLCILYLYLLYIMYIFFLQFMISYVLCVYNFIMYFFFYFSRVLLTKAEKHIYSTEFVYFVLFVLICIYLYVFVRFLAYSTYLFQISFKLYHWTSTSKNVIWRNIYQAWYYYCAIKLNNSDNCWWQLFSLQGISADYKMH